MLNFLTLGLAERGHRLSSTRCEENNDWKWLEMGSHGEWEILHECAAGTNSKHWLAQKLSETNTDVVYTHNDGPATAPLLAAKRAGIRTVFHVHDYTLFCERKFLLNADLNRCTGPESVEKCFRCLVASHRPLGRFKQQLISSRIVQRFSRAIWDNTSTTYRAQIERRAERRSKVVDATDCFLVTGPSVADTLLRMGVPYEKIFILPYVVTRPAMREQRSENWVRDAGPVRIGYFGRLSPEKAVWLLADALLKIQRISDASFDWFILSAGNSDIANNLRMRSGLPENRFHHLSLSTENEIRDALRRIDIAVFPSIWPEIGPLAMLEAIAQGVQCIAADDLGMAFSLKNDARLKTFHSGDDESLTAVLRQSLENFDEKPSAPNLARSQSQLLDTQQYFETLVDSVLKA